MYLVVAKKKAYERKIVIAQSTATIVTASAHIKNWFARPPMFSPSTG